MPRTVRLQHVTRTLRRASTAPSRPPIRDYKLPPKEPPKPADQPEPVSAVPKPKTAGTTGRILTGAIGGFIAYYIYRVVTSVPAIENHEILKLENQRDVSGKYDEQADDYDSSVGASEWLLGITSKRKQLARMCKGHVLEVGCGTGRNLGYFDVFTGSEVESLTFVDLSPKMVEICRRKWDALYPSNDKNLKKGLQVRFVAQSALSKIPPPPIAPSANLSKEKYDTILQTMTICSVPSPITLITNLAAHLNPRNPDARILLYEHGRSYREWLNSFIDSSAEKHAEKWGCWPNRDVAALVQEAAEKAGLEVVREKRWLLGTMSVFELKFRGKGSEKVEEKRAEMELGQMKGSGWFGGR